MPKSSQEIWDTCKKSNLRTQRQEKPRQAIFIQQSNNLNREKPLETGKCEPIIQFKPLKQMTNTKITTSNKLFPKNSREMTDSSRQTQIKGIHDNQATTVEDS